MAPRLRLVLLICAERRTAARLAALFQGPGYHVVAAPYGPAALSRAPDASLIIVDRIDGSPNAAAVIARFKSTQGVSTTPILGLAQGDDVEERVRLLDAGADDVMGRPFDPDEMRARIDGLLAIAEPAPTEGESAPADLAGAHRPRLVSFFSPKGGVGTTTLAVNVAVSMAARNDRTVALVDLDLEWGQVSTQLNISPHFSVVELARDSAALDDPELVRAYAEKHSSGLAVFASPARPDQGEMIGLEHVTRLLDGLQSTYDLTIVDVGSLLDERSLTVFEQSDRVVLVVTPEIPAVRAMHTLRELLAELGTPPERLFVVLNHIFQHDMLRLDDIERSLQTSVQAELLYDPIAYLKAVNEGIPLVSASNRGAAAVRLAKVTLDILDEHDDPEAADSSRTRRRLRVGTLLRRG